MNKFNLFEFVDAAMLKTEGRSPRASKVPSVWPSEASAVRIDKSLRPIDGKCHRQSFLRMIGTPETNSVDAVGAWRWVTGRKIEDHLTRLAKESDPKIFVASGVRYYFDTLYLPLELDLVVRNPADNKGWIVECKTYYGYMAGKNIVSEGKPKVENLFQVLLYLNLIRTGKKLKEIIREGLEAKIHGHSDRLRIEADLEELDKMDDGPLGAKLAYIARDDCRRTEFEIGYQEDFDGSIYPVVNGSMWKTWTIESLLERYRTLQNYWFVARREAKDKLSSKGINAPETLSLVLNAGDIVNRDSSYKITEEQQKAEEDYLLQLEQEMRRLPDKFWPPAEYEWAYSPDKVEKLYAAGEIGKMAYSDWKKKKVGKDRIGDWQCLYCPFKALCVPKQNPNLSYAFYDINNMSTLDEEL
jgi:hypothetical protein